MSNDDADEIADIVTAIGQKELELRKQRTIEGDKRAAAILEALLDDTRTTYGRDQVIKQNEIDVYTLVAIVNKVLTSNVSQRARLAALAGHVETHRRQKEIRDIWATGKYTSRDICAEEEYQSLGFGSYKAARNALKGTPDPNPWPAKKKSS